MNDQVLTTCFHLYCIHCFLVLEFETQEQCEGYASCRMCDDMVNSTVELDADQVLQFSIVRPRRLPNAYKREDCLSDEDQPESRSIGEGDTAESNDMEDFIVPDTEEIEVEPENGESLGKPQGVAVCLKKDGTWIKGSRNCGMKGRLLTDHKT